MTNLSLSLGLGLGFGLRLELGLGLGLGLGLTLELAPDPAPDPALRLELETGLELQFGLEPELGMDRELEFYLVGSDNMGTNMYILTFRRPQTSGLKRNRTSDVHTSSHNVARLSTISSRGYHHTYSSSGRLYQSRLLSEPPQWSSRRSRSTAG